MAVIVTCKDNPDSGLLEVASFSVVPRNKKPAVLPEGQICFDTVPTNFFTEWYKYYVLEGTLQINLRRISLEAAKGV